MRRIHLDTDIGGDSDDLCALAMLLGDPEVEIVGITTCADWHGVRASFVRHALKLAGRTDIPVASGAARFLGGQPHVPEPQDARYWPGAIIEAELRPSVDALDLMLRNAADGATVIAIGPFTNLALADTLRPGVLRDVVVMGGYTGPPPEGFPQWPASYDYNVQSDWIAARIVFERINPLIVPLNACLPVTLRTSDLPALRAGGPLSKLVALQGELQGAGSSSHETARDIPAGRPTCSTSTGTRSPAPPPSAGTASALKWP